MLIVCKHRSGDVSGVIHSFTYAPFRRMKCHGGSLSIKYLSSEKIAGDVERKSLEKAVCLRDSLPERRAGRGMAPQQFASLDTLNLDRIIPHA